jgi:hypothetical protein
MGGFGYTIVFADHLTDPMMLTLIVPLQFIIGDSQAPKTGKTRHQHNSSRSEVFVKKEEANR